MKTRLLTLALSSALMACLNLPLQAADTDDSNLSRYLFAYFEGSGEGSWQEHLRFALSRDAVNWRALNDNRPVIASDTIAKTQGIRDPHILRGESGEYLIVATDMNTVRDGWRENPGIVLLRSTDLVHWTHAYIDLPRTYATFSDAYWVWAPQVIYDASAAKYMIYFTLQRTGDGRSTLITYYAYANATFTAFEGEPQQLFAAKYGSIDNDIIQGPDGRWHLFYKGNTKDASGNEIKNGIQQAISDQLTGPYTEDFIYLDAYANSSTAVEGSSTFQLIGQQKYILMYDLYGAGRYEYQTSTDLMQWTQQPRSFTKDFMPRHGSVIPITLDEAKRLASAFPSTDIDSLLTDEPWVEPEDESGELLVSYSFDTDGDDSGLYPATLAGSATFVTMQDGNRILSTGSDAGYLDLGTKMPRAILRQLRNNYTISLDIYVGTPNSLGSYCWAWAMGSGTGKYSALVNRAGNADWYYEVKNSTAYVASSGRGLETGQWHTVTAVQKGNTCAIYIDGERCGSCITTLRPSSFASSVTQSWLGRSPYAADAYMTNTMMDNFRIYSKALTAAQVQELYAARPAKIDSRDIIRMDLDALTLPSSINNLYEGVSLPTQGTYGSTIRWKSGNTSLLSHQGRVVGTPQETRQHVTLTATLSYGGATATKTFDVFVHKKDSPYAHYLFTFFPSNSDENIYYALSDDGYNYTTINRGQPVVKARGITQMGGLRDPHILRGEDGTFYMVATDMQSSRGWDSNRGMVLMRSTDLVHWQTSKIHFPTRYRGTSFARVTRVWAPETIWDPVAQKYLIYFSILTNDGSVPYDKVFYAYANADFTDLEDTPTYFYDRGSATIDMDIVFNENDSLYHAVYKNEGSGGICQVTATTLTAPAGQEGSQWSAPSSTLQQTTEAVEGAGIFRLINSDDWILMYDCYMNGHYQFCSSPDLYHFTFRQNTATQGTFTPRHGTVIPITEAEYQRLLLLPDVTGIQQPGASQPATSRRKTLRHAQVIITDPRSANGHSFDLLGRQTISRKPAPEPHVKGE